MSARQIAHRTRRITWPIFPPPDYYEATDRNKPRTEPRVVTAGAFAASYADVGRRLLCDVSVSSSLGSRSFSFQNLDPVGRERERTEFKNGDTANAATTTWTYDSLGRLSSALQTRATTTVFNQQFTQTACNVTYDELGAILSQPTATGNRQYSFVSRLTCHWNNTIDNPFVQRMLRDSHLPPQPVDISLGQQTTNEMCLEFFGLAVSLTPQMMSGLGTPAGLDSLPRL